MSRALPGHAREDIANPARVEGSCRLAQQGRS